VPVEVANESEIAVDESEIAGICRFVLGEMQVNPMAELSVLCVDVEYMSSLHERWMGEKGPTDVLAFPMDDELIESGRQPDQGGRGPGSPAEPSDAPILVGDVVICPKVAERQALDHNVAIDDEMSLLVVHGVLHLLGFDHEDDDEAAAMEKRERELMARFRELERGQ